MPTSRIAPAVLIVLAVIFCAITAVGLAALYSVAGGSWAPWAERHALRFLMGLPR